MTNGQLTHMVQENIVAQEQYRRLILVLGWNSWSGQSACKLGVKPGGSSCQPIFEMFYFPLETAKTRCGIAPFVKVPNLCLF